MVLTSRNLNYHSAGLSPPTSYLCECNANLRSPRATQLEQRPHLELSLHPFCIDLLDAAPIVDFTRGRHPSIFLESMCIGAVRRRIVAATSLRHLYYLPDTPLRKSFVRQISPYPGLRLTEHRLFVFATPVLSSQSYLSLSSIPPLPSPRSPPQSFPLPSAYSGSSAPRGVQI